MKTGPLRASVRVQLHADFDLDEARKVVPYYHALGISHYYLSPILQARQGSAHGYDVTDPTRINAALGGVEALRRLVQTLREHAMGVLLDIVPNHMAASVENPWWLDVLRRGRESGYGAHFDIDWEAPDPDLRGRVLLPVLSNPLAQLLQQRAFELDTDDDGTRWVRAEGQRFPLRPDLPMPDRTHLRSDAEQYAEAWRSLLQAQHYRLAPWREAGSRINWRRFFDVGELVALRADLPVVFDDSHALLLDLYAEGLVDAFRIDHIDGLGDPPAYLRQLRVALAARAGERPSMLEAADAPIYVEKILGSGEQLPLDWPVSGTTGYEFMDQVGALLHDRAAEPAFDRIWQQASGGDDDPHSMELDARRQLLQTAFVADFDRLLREVHRALPGVAAEAVREALFEMLVHFPVYREYPAGETAAAAEPSGSTRRPLYQAVAQVSDLRPDLVPTVASLADLFQRPGEAQLRFQQLTPPLAAKSLEDTVFYRYAGLLSRNEVGSDPQCLGVSAGAFHAACLDRRRHWPHSLLATATHDHKRGEDVRARLAVLTGMPGAWQRGLVEWQQMTTAAERGPRPPDAVDQTFLLQTLVGAWPLDLEPAQQEGLEAFCARLLQWQQKALREGKRRSSWTRPDQAYEDRCAAWTRWLLLDPCSSDVRQSLFAMVDRVAAPGAVNGLAQALLRMTTPGVPDLYQGTELWDFSLVDPDNRRPVDYAGRRQTLAATTDDATLLENWRDGRIKQRLIQRTLQARRAHPALFAEGSYQPLQVAGTHARDLFAFARVHGDQMALVVVPLSPQKHIAGSGIRLAASWDDARITPPEGRRQRSWSSVLDGTTIAAPGLAAGSAGSSGIMLSGHPHNWPVTLLIGSGD